MRRTLALTRILEQPREQVFGALTEYERYPRLEPALTSARILAREGDVAVVELTHRLLAAPLVLEVVQTPPTRLSFTQVDRFRGQGVSGAFELAEAADRAGTRLGLCLEIPARPFTLRRRTHLHELIGKALDRLHRPARRDRGDVGEGIKILEVTRDGDGLRVWVLGSSYRLSTRDRP